MIERQLYHLSNQAIVEAIGIRLEKLRINEGLDQKALAFKAGVSVGTVQNAESGRAGIGLLKLVAILRALNALEELNNFIPPPPPKSIGLLNAKNQVRQRVTNSKKPKATKSTQWSTSFGVNQSNQNNKKGES